MARGEMLASIMEYENIGRSGGVVALRRTCLIFCLVLWQDNIRTENGTCVRADLCCSLCAAKGTATSA